MFLRCGAIVCDCEHQVVRIYMGELDVVAATKADVSPLNLIGGQTRLVCWWLPRRTMKRFHALVIFLFLC